MIDNAKKRRNAATMRGRRTALRPDGDLANRFDRRQMGGGYRGLAEKAMVILATITLKPLFRGDIKSHVVIAGKPKTGGL